MGSADSGNEPTPSWRADQVPHVTDPIIVQRDAMLHAQWGSDIDWVRVHAESTVEDPTVAGMDAPYWMAGLPISTLAFCGASERIRVAGDPSTPPDLVALIAHDPEVMVAQVASKRFQAEMGYPAFLAPSPTATAQGVLVATANATNREPQVSAGDRAARRTNAASIVFMTLAAFALIFAVAVSTATHWTVTDVPEQAETFHDEQYLTGKWIVTPGYGCPANSSCTRAFDQFATSPCYRDQDWTDCINAMVEEYNRECTRALTYESQSLCREYATEIDWMKSEDGRGFVVDEVGDHGFLRSAPEAATRQISNNDSRPAVTHEAVCYLGVLGECPTRDYDQRP